MNRQQLPSASGAAYDRRGWSTGYARWGIVMYLICCGWVLCQTRAVFWDEAVYLRQATALTPAHSWREWLRNNDSGPTGPLHSVMHYVLSGGTGILAVPWVRAPNLVLLGFSIALTWAALRSCRLRGEAAFGFMALPMTWVIGGMALTEMPAFAGIALAMLAAAKLGTAGERRAGEVWWLAALGCGIATATMGRQTYLVVAPALLLMAWRNRSLGFRAATAIGIGLVPLLCLFLTWGGIVPPKLAFVGGGLKFVHGVLAFAMLGIGALVLAPRFFWMHWRWASVAAVIAGVLDFLTGAVHFSTLTSVQRMLGSPGWAHAIERGSGVVAVMAGAGFSAAAAEAWWRGRDRIFAGAAAAVFALCGVCMAIVHQFSSRYPAMALPFFVLLLARWMDFGRWALLRCTIGAILGFAALRSYYLYAP